MKSSYLLLSFILLIETAYGKNVVNLRERTEQNLVKRDAKKLHDPANLKLSEDELDKLFHPYVKRQQIQLVEGSVDEINEKQRLFEQGIDVEALEREADDGLFHIAGTQSDGQTLGNAIISIEQVGIFARYARNSLTIDTKMNDPNEKLTFIVPTDDAILSLPLKPWEYPNSIGESDNNEDQVSLKNLDIFVKSHIVDSSIDLGFAVSSSSSPLVLKTLNKTLVKLVKSEDGLMTLQVQGYDDLIIKVIDVLTVDNGVLLIVDHVLEWPGM